jgi:dCMP deaminase
MTQELHHEDEENETEHRPAPIRYRNPVPALKTWMEIAIAFSKRSPAPDKQVGVVATDKGGVILGYGWNHSCDDSDPSTVDEYGKTKDTTLHAEDELLARVMESGKTLEGAILYMTHSPCMRCAARLKRAKVKRIFFLEEFKRGISHDFLINHGIDLVQVVDVDEEFDRRRQEAEDAEDHFDDEADRAEQAQGNEEVHEGH